jgi:hypothetical protein
MNIYIQILLLLYASIQKRKYEKLLHKNRNKIVSKKYIETFQKQSLHVVD